jgi:hypothetical protein
LIFSYLGFKEKDILARAVSRLGIYNKKVGLRQVFDIECCNKLIRLREPV